MSTTNLGAVPDPQREEQTSMVPEGVEVLPRGVSLEGVVRFTDVAVAALESAREEVDALNVYPVPDGDTGTNMYLTIAAARDAVERAVVEAGGPERCGVGRGLEDGDASAAGGHGDVAVSGEDEVDALHLLGQGAGLVFRTGRGAAVTQAAVDRHDHQVGLLLVPQPGHPDAGGLHRVQHLQARAAVGFHQALQGGVRQAEDGHAQALHLHHGVGREGGLAAPGVHHVGRQPGMLGLFLHLAEDRKAEVEVVVAHHHGVGAQGVQDGGAGVRKLGVDAVAHVGDGLALDRVAHVHQQRVGVARLELPHQGGQPRPALGLGLEGVGVLGHHGGVGVRGGEHLELQLLAGEGEGQGEGEQESEHGSLRDLSTLPRAAQPHGGAGLGKGPWSRGGLTARLDSPIRS